MSAAAGIGAISISTIEGGYRGKKESRKKVLDFYCHPHLRFSRVHTALEV